MGKRDLASAKGLAPSGSEGRWTDHNIPLHDRLDRQLCAVGGPESAKLFSPCSPQTIPVFAEVISMFSTPFPQVFRMVFPNSFIHSPHLLPVPASRGEANVESNVSRR